MVTEKRLLRKQSSGNPVGMEKEEPRDRNRRYKFRSAK